MYLHRLASLWIFGKKQTKLVQQYRSTIRKMLFSFKRPNSMDTLWIFVSNVRVGIFSDGYDRSKKRWPSSLNFTVCLIKYSLQRSLVTKLNKPLALFVRSHTFSLTFLVHYFFSIQTSSIIWVTVVQNWKDAFASKFFRLHSCFCLKYLGFWHRSRYESRRSLWKNDFTQWSQ